MTLRKRPQERSESVTERETEIINTRDLPVQKRLRDDRPVLRLCCPDARVL